MADDDLDELFRAKPEMFTALRTELAAAAKKRGDADAAKRITAARKPTMAAWVVNLLVQTNEDVKPSLSDLGDRLRAALGHPAATPARTGRPQAPRTAGSAARRSGP